MAKSDSQDNGHLASIRETVESIWIAVVLAFVLRAFVLEAFVIPTGSMAPRLMGQHWQFDCPACKYHYAYGIPTVPNSSAPDISRRLSRSGGLSGRESGPPSVCPNCGYQHYFEPEFAFGGDRVLVLKYLYRFCEPRPWEVVVFKNPRNNEENYIKRLIGLPGQMIEIVHGDVFVCDGKDRNGDGRIDESDFDVNGDGKADGDDLNDPRFRKLFTQRILRKSSETQEVMWQIIFDNDYQPDPAIYEAGTGRQWQPPWNGPEDVWKRRQGGRVFDFAGSPGQKPALLRFDSARERFCPNYAYNKKDSGMYDRKNDITSDLKLSFMFVPKAGDSRVGLHLSSFEHHFRAWLSADGSCRLEHGLSNEPGQKWEDLKGRTTWAKRNDLAPLKIGQACEVALTHVDRKVTLWLNGSEIITTNDALYPADRDRILHKVAAGVPTPTVAILASEGPSELRHIRLMRDVYYTCPNMTEDPNKPGRGITGNPMFLRKFNDKPDMDEFFVLGDNSPASLDSRLWDQAALTLRPGYRKGTVPRYNMIGRAFFVYWPGGFRLPLLDRLTIVPNAGRMRLIR